MRPSLSSREEQVTSSYYVHRPQTSSLPFPPVLIPFTFPSISYPAVTNDHEQADVDRHGHNPVPDSGYSKRTSPRLGIAVDRRSVKLDQWLKGDTALASFCSRQGQV